MTMPDHPRLLFDQAGIETLKARLAAHDWVKALWTRKLRPLDDVLRQPVELPDRGGNWWHWHISPVSGAHLTAGKRIGAWQWEHIDPITGKVFLGDTSHPSSDYDACVIGMLHEQWAQNARDLGVAYQVTGDRAYARKARDILMGYAAKYPAYDLHASGYGTSRTDKVIPRTGGGRVGSTYLEESAWLIPFCHGVDLVWDALSAEDRRAIAQKVVLPSITEVIVAPSASIHNIQCWANAAWGSAGLLLGDQALVAKAIEHPEMGYWKQVTAGVTPAGMWWEGSWGYHFYTLSALLWLTEAARNCGIDLYGEALERMFNAPLIFAMPNDRLPAFNDSGEEDLAARASPYELAALRYPRNGYDALLRKSPRTDDFALWFGKGTLAAAGRRKRGLAGVIDSGYSILTQGKGKDAAWVCMKHGPHGGWHDHADRLNFVLYARGEVIGVDPGTIEYGRKEDFEWYKTSVAHNTLVIDEMVQQKTNGRHIASGRAAGIDYAMAGADALYEGVRFIRSMALLNGRLLVVMDQVACDRERVMDLAYHHRGTWSDLPAGLPWNPPEKPGYMHLRDATVRKTDKSMRLTVETRKGLHSSIVLAGGEQTEAITAYGIGQSLDLRVPTVLFRRHAAQSLFYWAVSIAADPVALRVLPVLGEDGRALPAGAVAAVAVTFDGATHTLVANPDKERLRVAGPDGRERVVTDVFTRLAQA